MRKSSRPIRRLGVPIVMLLCATSGPAVAAIHGAPGSSSLHLHAGAGWQFVAEERLAANLVLDRWSGHGVTVAAVAYPGSRIDVTTTPNPGNSNRHARLSVSVTSGLPGKRMNVVPLTAEQELIRLGVPAAAAHAYTVKEAAPATPSTPSPPRDTPCVTVNEDIDSNGHARVQAYGCDRQYLDYSDPNDPGQWYLADDFQVSGDTQDTAILNADSLTDLTGGVVYSSGNTITKWDPGVTKPVGNCSTQTTHIGGTYSGFDASYDQATVVCPDDFGPKTISTAHFSSHWYGVQQKQNFFEQSIGTDYVDNPPSTAATVEFYVTVDYCWTFCGSPLIG